MKNNEFVLYEQIRQYLNGELEGTVLSKFKQQLQNDPQLAQDVQLHKDLSLIVEQESEQEQRLRTTLQNIHQSHPKSSAHPQWRIGSRVMTIAATLLVLMVSAYWFSTINSGSGLKHEELNLGKKGLLSIEEEGKLENFYNTGQYSQALPLIKKYLTQINTTDCSISCAKGVCELELGHLEDAEITFEAIKKTCTLSSCDTQKYLNYLTDNR